MIISKSSTINVRSGSISANSPRLYLNRIEIDKIKNKINANINPWKSAYGQAMNLNSNSQIANLGWARSIADAGTLPSITQSGCVCRNDKHYYCEVSTCRTASRMAYDIYLKMSRAIGTLGLSFGLNGTNADANRAIKLAKNWCLNSTSKMYPVFADSWQPYWDIPVGTVNFFFALDMIWNYSGWNPTDKAGIINWISTIINHAKNFEKYSTLDPAWRDSLNDFFRIEFIASGAILIRNQPLLDYAINQWKTRISDQIHNIGPDGRNLRQKRTHNDRWLSYSIFDLHSMVRMAELARHNGVDLYDWKASNGNCLENVFDFLDYYLADPALISPRRYIDNPKNDGSGAYNCQLKSGTICGRPKRWYDSGFCQGQCYSGADIGAYEYAYFWKHKASYWNVINNFISKRPFVDYRYGFPTLTHASGAYEFLIY